MRKTISIAFIFFVTLSFAQELKTQKLIIKTGNYIHNGSTPFELADMNSDGLLDQIVNSKDEIKLYLNNGSKERPNFSNKAKILFNYNYVHKRFPSDFKIADINLDGLLDIIIANPDELRYYQNIGNKKKPIYRDKGKRLFEIDYHHKTSTIRLVIEDLNNDSKPDFIISTSREIVYFLQH